jgi:hypothetical protein
MTKGNDGLLCLAVGNFERLDIKQWTGTLTDVVGSEPKRVSVFGSPLLTNADYS